MNFEHPDKRQTLQLIRLWKEVFGEYDGFWELFWETAFLPDHCRCITEAGQPIAGLYWFDCSCGTDRIAYVYAVATDPRYRGKGLCRMLMAEVHTLLKDQGYDSVMLVPADPGLREMYRKMGYENCTQVGELSCNAGTSPVEIRSVSTEEYAALRREMLPSGSVLQEGNNLTFLAAQAQLFAGKDFLLAAYLDGDTLHGMELLGNPKSAPGILRALGCEQGKFQIPGTERAFAMIHKLSENAVTPAYFGFSFD